MAARSKIACLVMATCLCALVVALSGCASSAPASGSSASQASSSSSAVSSSSSTATSSSSSTAGAQTTVSMALKYSAGTGYEWQCSVEPSGVIEEVSHTTENLSQGTNVAGGSLSDRYIFRALAPGEAVVTFKLLRSWEPDNPAETQVYAFTVADDLQMILNPYKSDFDDEPVWESA